MSKRGLGDVNSDCLTSPHAASPEDTTCDEPSGRILPFNWLPGLTTALRWIIHRKKTPKGQKLVIDKLLTSLPWSHRSVLEKGVCCGGLSEGCSHLQWRSQWPTDQVVCSSAGKCNWKHREEIPVQPGTGRNDSMSSRQPLSGYLRTSNKN